MIDLLIANFFSFFVNLATLLNYYYLQKTKNIFTYTIFCLITSILFLIRGILFKDYACVIFEFFWVYISIKGIKKCLEGK